MLVLVDGGALLLKNCEVSTFACRGASQTLYKLTENIPNDPDSFGTQTTALGLPQGALRIFNAAKNEGGLTADKRVMLRNEHVRRLLKTKRKETFQRGEVPTSRNEQDSTAFTQSLCVRVRVCVRV